MQPPTPTPQPTEVWLQHQSRERMTLEPFVGRVPRPSEEEPHASTVHVLAQYAESDADNPCTFADLSRRMEQACGRGGLAKAVWMTFGGRQTPLYDLEDNRFQAATGNPWGRVPFAALVIDPHAARIHHWTPDRLKDRLDVEADAYVAWLSGDVYAIRHEVPDQPRAPSAYVVEDYTGPYFGRGQARRALAEACSFEGFDYGGWKQIL